MLEVVMVQPGQIEFNEVPKPGVEKDHVLIEVKACGVCGSDLHVYHGKHPFTSYPVIQGHEFAGVVDAVGSEVEGIRPGQKVTVVPSLVCGRCYPCRHGRANICDELKVMGFQAPGCHRNFFSVPADNVIPIMEELSFEAGAMVEPLAVGVHAVRRADLKAGMRVLVLGAGPIGLLTMQAAKASGASEVLIVDRVDSRLEAARKLGADHTVNGDQEAVAGAIRRAFGADGADLIFECVGLEATVETAVQVGRKGARIMVVGVVGGRPRISIGVLQDRELELVGTLMYMRPDFEQAIAWIAEGLVTPTELITARFPFGELPRAYQEADEHPERNLKVMVLF